MKKPQITESTLKRIIKEELDLHKKLMAAKREWELSKKAYEKEKKDAAGFVSAYNELHDKLQSGKISDEELKTYHTIEKIVKSRVIPVLHRLEQEMHQNMGIYNKLQGESEGKADPSKFKPADKEQQRVYGYDPNDPKNSWRHTGS